MERLHRRVAVGDERVVGEQALGGQQFGSEVRGRADPHSRGIERRADRTEERVVAVVVAAADEVRPEGLEPGPVREVTDPCAPREKFCLVDLAGHGGPPRTMPPEKIDRLAEFGHADRGIRIGQRMEFGIGMVTNGKDRGAAAVPSDRLGHSRGIPAPAGNDADRFTGE